MAEVNKAKRVFVIGTTKINDPAPSETLETSVRLLAQTYPQFRATKVFEEDAVVVGDTLEFTLVLPPPKTNG